MADEPLRESKSLNNFARMPSSIRDLGYQPQAYKEKKFNLLRPQHSSIFAIFQLIFRWRASIWQAVWKHLVAFWALFLLINITYRFILTEEQRSDFEKLSATFTYYISSGTVPLAFVLGFYVQQIYTRWWEMWMALPWIEQVALLVHVGIGDTPARASESPISDEKARGGQPPQAGDLDLRLAKLSIVRYCNLGFALASRSASEKIKALYPDLDCLIQDGLLTQREKEEIEEVSSNYLPHTSDWWQPFTWAVGLVQRCQKEGHICNDMMFNNIQNQILAYRAKCAHMFDYDMVGVPLIYTQLAAFATYAYFVVVLIGRAQFLDPSKGYEGNMIDFYFPLFSTIEFIIFMGWLQVAMRMLDPYGLATDDVSFDLHWVLHRNVEVGNVIVTRKELHPELQYTVPLSGPGSVGRSNLKKYGGRHSLAQNS